MWEVAKAWEILGDPQQRSLYDAQRSTAPAEVGWPKLDYISWAPESILSFVGQILSLQGEIVTPVPVKNSKRFNSYNTHTYHQIKS